MSHTASRLDTSTRAHQGHLDRWTVIAERHRGVRVALGETCPEGMTMWSVVLQGPIHERMNLGHWAFPDRTTADAAVGEMDTTDRTRNTVLTRPGQ